MKANYLTLNLSIKTEDETDEDPMDEDEVFENLPPRKQWVYNEMVEFQKELRQHGLAGSLHRVIHAQQEKINPPMPTEVAQKRWLLLLLQLVSSNWKQFTQLLDLFDILHPSSSKKNCQKYT